MAAIIGWHDVLVPALRDGCPVSLWSFDGLLPSLLVLGKIVVAETWPTECYSWFSKEPLGGKRSQDNRRKFGPSLLRWAGAQKVTLEDGLRKEIHDGFPQREKDAFDAVVGLFGMIQVCLGQRAPGEPDESAIRDIKGWILGRPDRRGLAEHSSSATARMHERMKITSGCKPSFSSARDS